MSTRDETTRRRLIDRLDDDPATPSELAAEFDLTTAAVLAHLDHVAHTVEGEGRTLLVAPPTCRDCDFDGFDDLLNLPSRCPECKSESVAEPQIVIE